MLLNKKTNPACVLYSIDSTDIYDALLNRIYSCMTSKIYISKDYKSVVSVSAMALNLSTERTHSLSM